MKSSKLLSFSLLLAATMATAPQGAMSQVTIGADEAPQSFSVLELISNNSKGLRLPQLTQNQRDALVLTGNDLAKGLTIFNLTSRCVEYWNGTIWQQQCGPDGPFIPPVSPRDNPSSCGITPTANGSATVFTAKADGNAESYEFFVGGVSQGEQSTNVLTLASAPGSGTAIEVKYYYPLAFLKPEMVEVKGSSSWEYGPNSIATTVTIRDFKMSKTEVTQAQFEYVMGVNPACFQCGGTPATYCGNNVSTRPTSALPVENVSWYDAIIYCNKLSIMDGKTPCYVVSGVDFTQPVTPPTSDNATWNAATCNFAANGYRLPTESEWEYAARGGINAPATANFFSGGGTSATDETALTTLGWYSGNNGTSGSTVAPYYGTKPVGQKLPNELGLFDMSGNVYEWCWNWASETNPMATPTGTVAASGGSNRVLRGGGYLFNATNCRVSSRNITYPDMPENFTGIRLAFSSVE